MARLQKNRIKLFQEYLEYVKKANAFVGQIDPFIKWQSWIFAGFSGLASVGALGVIAGLYQNTVSKYSDLTKISHSLVVGILVLYLVYVIGKAVISIFLRKKQRDFELKTERFFEMQVVEQKLKMDLGRLSDPEYYHKSEIGWQSKNAIINIFDSQAEIIRAAVSVCTLIAVFSFIDPWLILLILIPVIPKIIKEHYFNKIEIQERHEKILPRRKERLYSHSLSEPDVIMQNRLARKIPFLVARFVEFSDLVRFLQRKNYVRESRADLILSLLDSFVVFSVLWYMVHSFTGGRTSIPELIVSVGMLTSAAFSIFELGQTILKIKKNIVFYKEFIDFMEIKPLIDESNALPIVLKENPNILFRNVTFSYPRNKQVALSDVNLEIPAGQNIAIVGRNGCGKTTMLKLLSKVYIPDVGEVLINDTPTTAITQDSWLDQVEYVTQNSTVSGFTLKEALTGSDNPDMDRLNRAAEVVDFNSVLKSKELRYDSPLGSGWKDGAVFSGGELQRLKLTSAFYRILEGKVKVVLFDEPMAGCDKETDAIFYQALTSLKEQTVCVVIHNPNYLYCFDRVIEMNDGKIVKDLTSRNDILEYQENVLKSIKSIKNNQVSEQFSLAV